MTERRMNTVVTLALIPEQVAAIEDRGDELQAFCEVAIQERIEGTASPKDTAMADLVPKLQEEIAYYRALVAAITEQRDRALADHARGQAQRAVEEHRALRNLTGGLRADESGPRPPGATGGGVAAKPSSARPPAGNA
jgi:hypothetical protein